MFEMWSGYVHGKGVDGKYICYIIFYNHTISIWTLAYASLN